MAGSELLRFEGVCRRFGHRTILRDVNLRVGPGAAIAILGPNGSGKTTLLRLAAGLLRPTTGQIVIDGAAAGSRPARARVAFVPQEPATYAELSALDHLVWWSRLHGRPAAHAPLLAWLAEAGIAEAAARPTGELSRGQRQRLALCMAFVQQPDLLLLDEPYTALDVAGAAWLDGRLEARRGAGGATLLVDHDEPRARRHASRVLRIEGTGVVEVPA